MLAADNPYTHRLVVVGDLSVLRGPWEGDQDLDTVSYGL
jgi:hypothetical protein